MCGKTGYEAGEAAEGNAENELVLNDLFPDKIKSQGITNNGRLEDDHQVDDDDDPAGKDSEILKESLNHCFSCALLARILFRIRCLRQGGIRYR